MSDAIRSNCASAFLCQRWATASAYSIDSLLSISERRKMMSSSVFVAGCDRCLSLMSRALTEPELESATGLGFANIRSAWFLSEVLEFRSA